MTPMDHASLRALAAEHQKHAGQLDALDRALANLMRAQRDLTADVLAAGTGDIASRLAAWQSANPAAIDRITTAVQGLTEGEMTVSRLSVAAGLLADLAKSA